MANGHRPPPISTGTNDEGQATQIALDHTRTPALRESGRFKAELKRYLKEQSTLEKLSLLVVDSRRYILEAFADKYHIEKPGDISTSICQNWYDSLAKPPPGQKPYAERTCEDYLLLLRAFCRWLVKEKLISADPTKPVLMKRVMKVAKKDFVYRIEIRRLLAAGRLETRRAKQMLARIAAKKRQTGDVRTLRDAKQLIRHAQEMEMMLYMGFDEGFRKNEMIHAMPEWFQRSKKSVNISRTQWFKPKDRQERTVPLTNRFQRFIKREYPHGLPSPWVLNPQKTPGKYKYRYDPKKKFLRFMRTWQARSVGGRYPNMHMLRHSFASNRLIGNADGKKVDPFRVAEWLGDTMETMQFNYGHLLADDPEVNIGV